MIRAAVAAVGLLAATSAAAREPAGLHTALEQLTRDGKFSGAVVIRGGEGVRFARGYGFADPFKRRAFTPATPADSGSLAKPVTAAAVLTLERDGKIDLDAPVRQYLPEYPHAATTVRHLLAHSAGLTGGESEQAITGKTNAQLIANARREPAFAPGTAFAYCNYCYIALALLIERVSARPYIDFVRERVALPPTVTLRPARLADWKGRAIGYRRARNSRFEHADSYEGELFYGSGNFRISASQFALWGTEWWQPRLAPIRTIAISPATISAKVSGLTWGNWYCASHGRRCHYLGHHEGFHHMLYWDADRRISVAMISNNSLAPALQQRLQRAIVSFAVGRDAAARRELAAPFPDRPVEAGTYTMPFGETEVTQDGDRVSVSRNGLAYAAYPIGSGIRYVPGLDVYLSGGKGGVLHWLGLHEDYVGRRSDRR